MKGKKKHKGKKWRKLMQAVRAAAFLAAGVLGLFWPDGMETVRAVSLSNPRIVTDSSMRAGQKVTWDCIWFGSYPQAEVIPSNAAYTALDESLRRDGDVIVSDSVYAALQSASGWDANNDIILDGEKYRRMKKGDVTYANGNSSVWYYQWSNGTDYHYFRYEPVKWRVLRTDGNQALLLSDIALDDQRYHTENENVTWETSTMRSWLNGYGTGSNKQSADYRQKNFIGSAFNASERAAIVNTSLENADNLSHGTEGGNNTTDKIFLLSESEVWNTDIAKAQGFVKVGDANDEARRCQSSAYAKAMGMWSCVNTDWTGNGQWWLRSPGEYEYFAMYIDCNGWVNGKDNNVFERKYGVRPALNLNLSSSNLYTYAGTVYSDGTIECVEHPRVTLQNYLNSEEVEVFGTQNVENGKRKYTQNSWNEYINKRNAAFQRVIQVDMEPDEYMRAFHDLETAIASLKLAAENCECTLGNITGFEGGTPDLQGSTEITVTLGSGAYTYSNNCIKHGNPEPAISYALLGNPAGATLTGNVLKVTQSGSVQVRFTVTLGDQTKSATATYTVVKTATAAEKDALAKAIKEVEDKYVSNADKYTADSWKKLDDALKAGKALGDDAFADQVVAATMAIKDAIAGMKIVANPPLLNIIASFNANGGNVSLSNKFVTCGSAYGTLPAPTRSGYTFTGWYTSANGGNRVTESTIVAAASNHTLYAHWEEGESTVQNPWILPNPSAPSMMSVDLKDVARKNHAITVSSGGLSLKSATGITEADKYLSLGKIRMGAKRFTLKLKADGVSRITYKSSSKKTASISSKGVVKIRGVGTTTITVTGILNSTGKKIIKKYTLTVNPDRMTIKSIRAVGDGRIKIYWKKDKKGDWYEMCYSRSRNFKGGKKTVTVQVSKAYTVMTVKDMVRNAKYYVRMRSCKVVSGIVYYGEWSKTKTVKVR